MLLMIVISRFITECGHNVYFCMQLHVFVSVTSKLHPILIEACNFFYLRYLEEEWRYIHENVPAAEVPIPKEIWDDLPKMIRKKKIMVNQLTI